jgi:plastocyanin
MAATQRRTARTLFGMGALTLATACGSDSTTPGTTPPTIAKASTKSGDEQTGPAGQPLPSDLRVVVTRDGQPASEVVVTWSTGFGTVVPGSDKSDVDGVSTTTWTLGTATGAQTAVASITGATGSPVTFTATATGGTPGPQPTTIQVLGPAGGNRFSPADVTVIVGSTVNWVWPDGALSHSVVPDDGTTPASSGVVTNGPHLYSFTFATPGTYSYHCATHGGQGMVGTVTVVTAQP